MIFLWPVGICFLAFKTCQDCTESIIQPVCLNGVNDDKCQSVEFAQFGPNGKQFPTAAIVDSNLCRDHLNGAFVRLDDPKLLQYVKQVATLADKSMIQIEKEETAVPVTPFATSTFEETAVPSTPVATSTLEGRCSYTCKQGGSCNVKLFSTTVPKNGNTQGFCFSPEFGGKCSGTPSSCNSCNEICESRKEPKFTLPTINEPTLAQDESSKTYKVISMTTNAGENSCLYTCKKSTACEVVVKTNYLFSGYVKGSCFPEEFGGECSGTPQFCLPCNEVCKNGLSQDSVTTPITFPVDNKPTIDASKVNLVSLIPPSKPDSCVYLCKAGGSCTVHVIREELATGFIMGFCFSKEFGGQCQGTPKMCQPCSAVCNVHARQGGIFIEPISGDKVTLVGKVQEPRPDPNSQSCIYDCKASGSCTVSIMVKWGVAVGNTVGSCFSDAFGGKCSGIPTQCKSCKNVCKGKHGEIFSTPITF